MGTDNLFHKRKGKGTQLLQRRKASKVAAPFYLIVCEGEKTEPNYFNELRTHERISSITIRVSGECGSAPVSVVEYAVALYDELTAEGNSIEGVFCVFDKDNHESYDKAIARIREKHRSGVPIKAIPSNPCFEYWLVLHYAFSRAPYSSAGGITAARRTYQQLHLDLAGYQKGATGLYVQLKSRQAAAIQNAKNSFLDAVQTGQYNPTTQVHELVEELLRYAEV